MKPITFTAAVHRVTTDHEGEGRVTLTIPLSDLGAALLLATQVNKALIVTVQPVEG